MKPLIFLRQATPVLPDARSPMVCSAFAQTAGWYLLPDAQGSSVNTRAEFHMLSTALILDKVEERDGFTGVEPYQYGIMMHIRGPQL